MLDYQQLFDYLTQFGVAGLMGLLWVWERTLSRKRETQLDQAHQLIKDERKQLALLVDLVSQNTQALQRLELTSTRLERTLDDVTRETHTRPPAP